MLSRRSLTLGLAAALVAVAGPLSYLRSDLRFVFLPLTFMLPVLGVAVAAWMQTPTGLAALTLALAGQEYGEGYVNPFLVVIAYGPWLVSYLIRSRRDLAEQLRLRAAELQREQELFAYESVRYERARIARELHDIVAHCLSVMVVQANAGQRLVTREPGLASEVLDNIAEAAHQAQTEMARLVELLGDEPAATDEVGLDLVTDLVRQARTTGLEVTTRFTGNFALPAPTAAAAYRIVQEALTNALKHAPGAAVVITIDGRDDVTELVLSNAAPPAGAAPLHRIGGGHGLRGMQERAQALGGSVHAGPTFDGGWRVTARFPSGRRAGASSLVGPSVASLPAST